MGGRSLISRLCVRRGTSTLTHQNPDLFLAKQLCQHTGNGQTHDDAMTGCGGSKRTNGRRHTTKATPQSNVGAMCNALYLGKATRHADGMGRGAGFISKGLGVGESRGRTVLFGGRHTQKNTSWLRVCFCNCNWICG